MTIHEATMIAEYIKTRNILMSKIEDYERCDSISGNINSGCNGLGFRWENGKSYEIMCLLNGLQAELERINEIIFGVQIYGLSIAEESEGDTE